MADEPEVSVVVATHNRGRRLRELLGALRAQSLPPARFEVVVVDDASSDDTGLVLAEETQRGGLRLKLLRRTLNGGSGIAREQGWRAADGPLIAFTDDDCVPAADWLERLLAVSERHPGGVVQGRTDPIAAELESVASWRRPFTRTVRVSEPDHAFQTCNVAYPRDVLARIGGFDVGSYPRYPGEDADLAQRAIESGARPVFAPEVRVAHAVNDLGPIGRLRHAAAWDMKVYAQYPRLRRAHFSNPLFWKDTHSRLAGALLALLPWRRLDPVRGWLAYRYLQALRGRTVSPGGGLASAPYYALLDLVELVTVARGAIRHRTPML